MPTLRDIEYDAFTGITKRWYLDQDKIVCHKTWDERPLVQAAKRIANSTIDQGFINSKKTMHHMASLPPLVIEELLKKHNLNVLGDLTPAEQKKLNRLIETEYPWCKTHTKKLWRPHGVK